jgi:hypothetical protein
MLPIVADAPQRVAGLHAGEIQIAADFDAPLLTIRENTR